MEALLIIDTSRWRSRNINCYQVGESSKYAREHLVGNTRSKHMLRLHDGADGTRLSHRRNRSCLAFVFLRTTHIWSRDKTEGTMADPCPPASKSRCCLLG